jgi:hypothetical protein
MQTGEPWVPKKEVAINPINPRGELAMLVLPLGENQALRVKYSPVRCRV